jgi:hypothetical protein
MPLQPSSTDGQGRAGVDGQRPAALHLTLMLHKALTTPDMPAAPVTYGRDDVLAMPQL